jgi:hypothetical protein
MWECACAGEPYLVAGSIFSLPLKASVSIQALEQVGARQERSSGINVDGRIGVSKDGSHPDTTQVDGAHRKLLQNTSFQLVIDLVGPFGAQSFVADNHKRMMWYARACGWKGREGKGWDLLDISCNKRIDLSIKSYSTQSTANFAYVDRTPKHEYPCKYRRYQLMPIKEGSRVETPESTIRSPRVSVSEVRCERVALCALWKEYAQFVEVMIIHGCGQGAMHCRHVIACDSDTIGLAIKIKCSSQHSLTSSTVGGFTIIFSKINLFDSLYYCARRPVLPMKDRRKSAKNTGSSAFTMNVIISATPHLPAPWLLMVPYSAPVLLPDTKVSVPVRADMCICPRIHS